MITYRLQTPVKFYLNKRATEIYCDICGAPLILKFTWYKKSSFVNTFSSNITIVNTMFHNITTAPKIILFFVDVI